MLRLRRKMAAKGFTLVELIIVMAILAIIAALVVPRYLNFLSDAKVKAINSDIAMISNAVELCIAYDPDGKSLVTEYAVEKAIEEKEPLIPKYLKEQPKDPDGNVYKLKVEDKGASGYAITVTI